MVPPIVEKQQPMATPMTQVDVWYIMIYRKTTSIGNDIPTQLLPPFYKYMISAYSIQPIPSSIINFYQFPALRLQFPSLDLESYPLKHIPRDGSLSLVESP